MKSIKEIFMVVAVAMFMFAPFSGKAQTKRQVIDISQIGTNITVLEFKSGKDRIMAFDISKDKRGFTTILPNFNNTPFNNVNIELYNGEKLVAEYVDDRKSGPNNSFDNFIFYENEIPYKTYINSKEEFWPLLAAIVLCCVQAEVTYSDQGGWGGSLGFDCDCLGKSAKPTGNPQTVSIKGKEYSITKMKFIPLNQSKSKIGTVKNLSISLN